MGLANNLNFNSRVELCVHENQVSAHAPSIHVLPDPTLLEFVMNLAIDSGHIHAFIIRNNALENRPIDNALSCVFCMTQSRYVHTPIDNQASIQMGKLIIVNLDHQSRGYHFYLFSSAVVRMKYSHDCGQLICTNICAVSRENQHCGLCVKYRPGSA